MTRSQTLFTEAKKHLPGGVNSPVRAFSSVGGDPVFIKRAEGVYMIDEDDNRYIDYVGSWGPMIAGHAHPAIVKAVQETVANGLSFGAPTAIETELAEAVKRLMPSIELLRFCSSGTEATMSALRLARGFTGRDIIVKFEGCYHGHSDSLLVKAGSGALTLGVPTSPGVPAAVAELTLTLTFNSIAGVEETFKHLGEKIAAIIVEPVAGNMNCIPPAEGFLECLREQCTQYGSVLIFDEVMTGFRLAAGGAQEIYDITPDITTLGKIVGGGMPVGAFGGRADIMQKLSPLGPVYQAGTLSGNPVAMIAGLTTLNLISEPGFYDALGAKTKRLVDGVMEAAKRNNIPMASNQVGGMFGLFFTERKTVTDFAGATSCDVERFKKFFHGMLKEGVYLAPSAFEAGFMSSAHTDAHIDETIAAADRVFAGL